MDFSIAMCTYNGAAYVSEQLESIASQTRPPQELVICDDGSVDATLRHVETFASQSSIPIRLFVNQSNLGSTKNFERAIGLCRGDIIALSDQDDVWLPKKLERIAECFSSAPRVGMVFTDAEVVDENLLPLDQRLWDKVGLGNQERRLLRSRRAVDVLLPGWLVTGATMAFRARYKDLILDIPVDIDMIHDGWVALVVAAVADLDFIAEPLIKYRQHQRQQVGAPDKSAIDKGGIVAAARRQTSYTELIKIAERLQERLLSRGALSGDDRVIRMLDARLTHLRARVNLPKDSLRRTGWVLRELLTLRYHHYSRGIYSAIKDLVA
jgi:glycosyltransferase involved in cell wall biosynthesis